MIMSSNSNGRFTEPRQSQSPALSASFTDQVRVVDEMYNYIEQIENELGEMKPEDEIYSNQFELDLRNRDSELRDSKESKPDSAAENREILQELSGSRLSAASDRDQIIRMLYQTNLGLLLKVR